MTLLSSMWHFESVVLRMGSVLVLYTWLLPTVPSWTEMMVMALSDKACSRFCLTWREGEGATSFTKLQSLLSFLFYTCINFVMLKLTNRQKCE